MNKLYTLNLNNAKGSTQAIRFSIDTSQPRKPIALAAQPNVRYEIIDEATLNGPQNLIFKRNGKDLYIAFLDERVDLVLENFYGQPQNGIVGLAEDGNFYRYVPESGYNLDYVMLLPDGAASWNALGGDPSTPLFAPDSSLIHPPAGADHGIDLSASLAQGGPAFAGWPYYLGLLVAGGGIAALRYSTDDTPALANPQITQIAENIATPVNLISGQVTYDLTPRLSGTGAINQSLKVYANGTLLGPVTTDENGRWTYDVSPLTPGTYAITVANATDGTPVMSDAFYVTLANSETYTGIGAGAIVTGTPSNENFILASNAPGRLDAANGIDTLMLGEDGMAFTLQGKPVSHFEIFDLARPGNQLNLQLSDVLDQGSVYTDHALTIKGPAGAILNLDMENWARSGTTTDGQYMIYHPTRYAAGDLSHDLWVQNGLTLV